MENLKKQFRGIWVKCKLLLGRLPAISTVIAALAIFLFSVHPVQAINQNKTDGPQRIVSLSPAVTESLYLLGMADSVVGVTTFCNRPVEARSKTKIGTLIEPDVEKIVSLRPDLVIAMSLTNHKTLKKMRDIGLNVLLLEVPDTFSRLCDVFKSIGDATGRSVKARRIIEEAWATVSDIRKRTGRMPKPRVLVQIGAKPFFVATNDFFINDLIEFSGAVNVFKDARSGNVSREEAVIQNPDVIFVVTMGISGENERQAWDRFRTVNAVKQRRIYLIDSDDVCSPTPVSFASFLENVAKLLHPGIKKGLK